MARAILICGKICSGKSTYARELCAAQNAVLMSVDELMLALFEPHLGNMHDEYARRSQSYLLHQSLQIIKAGIDVVLDWGFWTRESRSAVQRFLSAHGVEWELHYLEVCDQTWQSRIQRRNADVLAGASQAYYVDDNLMNKFRAQFEAPDSSEPDVRIQA